MYHLGGEINRSFYACVTFQWLLLVCSFGVVEFIEETNRVCEGGVYPKPLGHLLELLCALLQRRCLRVYPRFSQATSLALTRLLQRYPEQLSVYSLT